MLGLGSLVVHLAANISGFSADLGKAAHEADRRMKSIGDAAEKAGKLVSTAMLAGAGTMAVLVKQSINGADATAKMAQGAGLATEACSELAFAADLSGVSTQQLSTSLARLNRNISDTAAGTGEAREAFAALGLEVKNADGSLKNADTIMAEVADKFVAMEDGAGKSALAVMLFGRAGAEMIPMLNQGAAGMAAMREEARALGLTIDTQTGQAAERFNDNLTRLNAAKQGVANTIMRALLPQMNALTNAMVEAAKAGEQFNWIAKAATVLFQTLVVLGSDLSFVFRMAAGELETIGAQLRALAQGDFTGYSVLGKEWKKESAQARADLDAFQARIMNLGNQAQITGTFLEDVWQMGKGKAPTIGRSGEAEKIAAANARLVQESMRGSVKAAEEMQDVADALVYTWDGLGNRVTMTREELKQLEDQALRATQSWVESAKISAEQADAMVYSWDAAGNRIVMTREAFENLDDAAKKALDTGQELGWAFSSVFENILIEGGKASEVLRGLAKDIARIILRQTVTQPMATAIAGAMSGMFGGARAEGGPVTAGRSYLVGERGVERFVPEQDGQIVPSGGGGVVVNMVNHFSVSSPAAARDAVLGMMPMVVDTAKRAVFEARARGAG